MPWDLPEFERNRLEKARKLLQESEEHRGCRDLQLYVEGKDLTVQLHRIFLDDSGQRRQGLTAQEKLQGLIVFVRMALCILPVMFMHHSMEPMVYKAIKDAIEEIREPQLPWGGLLANIVAVGYDGLQAQHNPTAALQNIIGTAAKLTAQPGFPALSAALELHQRSSGFDPVMSAAEIRLLALHSQQKVAQELLKRQPEAPEAQQWLEGGLSANRQLLQLDPNAAACFYFKRGSLMATLDRGPEALVAFRSALREAPEHKSHLVESRAAEQVATTLALGFGGPRWNVEEVRGLLRTAKTALAKCKWMPPDVHANWKQAIAEMASSVATETAGSPAATMLPTLGRREFETGQIAVSYCSGCGEAPSSLKKCSSCGVAAYCSRACQLRHWKQGGHKQECAQLAARSSGGAGSS